MTIPNCLISIMHDIHTYLIATQTHGRCSSHTHLGIGKDTSLNPLHHSIVPDSQTWFLIFYSFVDLEIFPSFISFYISVYIIVVMTGSPGYRKWAVRARLGPAARLGPHWVSDSQQGGFTGISLVRF